MSHAQLEERSDPGIHRVVSTYGTSNLFGRLLGLLYAYIKPKLLPPEAIGLWNLLRVVTDYAGLADLGANAATRYRIPVLEKRGDAAEISKVKAAAFWGALAVTSAVTVVLVLLAVWPRFTPLVRVGLLTIAVLVMLNWYSGYLVTLLKSHQLFAPLTLRNYLLPAVLLAAGIPLLLIFGLYGLYAASIIGAAAEVILLVVKKPRDAVAAFEWQTYLNLVRQGLPIMLFDAGMVLLTTADRILISSFLGIKQLGFYVIAIAVADLALRIPGAAREVIEPRMAQALESGNATKALEEYYLSPLYSTAYYFPFVVCGAHFVLPVAISWLLPRYVAGILPAQVLVFGVAFLALAYATRGLVVLNRWQFQAAVIEILALIINVAVTLSLLFFGYGLGAVATGTAVSYLVLFVGLFLYIEKRLGRPGLRLTRHLPVLLLPASLLGVLLLLAPRMMESTPLPDPAKALVGASAVMGVMLGLAAAMSRRSSLLSSPGELMKNLAPKPR